MRIRTPTCCADGNWRLPLRIVFAVWDTGISGGVRAIFEIANGLGKRNHDVRIVALGGKHSWHNIEVPVDYIQQEKSLYMLERWRSQIYSLLTFKLERRLSQSSNERIAQTFGFHADLTRALAESIPPCDICVATWYPTALSVWISGKGTPYYFLQDFPEQYEAGSYDLRLFEKTLELPFNFLTNSKYTEDLVLRRQNKANVRVIGVGVDMEKFYPRNPRILHRENKEVMVVLKDQKFKGADVAIRTLNELNKRIRIHATLVGSKKPLGKVSPEFPYTLFQFVDDDSLANLYSAADVFAFTSYAEGFGLPPLEAMACGTPVVTTDCKGNRDYAVNQFNCLVVRPGDHHALTKAVERVLTDGELAEKLRTGGAETAKLWTWNRVVDRFEETLGIHRTDTS